MNRHHAYLCTGLSLAVVVLIAVVAWRGPASGAAEPEAKKPPPLKIDRSAPLLLDEAVPTPSKKKHVADNEACYVCHGNYTEEEFVRVHAEGDVGCMKCHGESFAHRGDEDNVTAPDKMFAAEDIAKNCATCHDTHDAPAAKVIARWKEKCPARTDPKQLLCTDCHGEHRLKFRTVWWDKKTGKLGERLPGEKFRMNPDLTKVPE